MEIPNFLIAGAAKSGTSWIHQCLREHPEVFVPRRKEVRFFSVNYEKGERWYLNFFKNRSNEEAVGESSPSYLACEDAPDRIYKWNPNMKIIFVLRDPVERPALTIKCYLDQEILTQR